MGDLCVWHDGPLPEGVKASAHRLAESDDVRRVALMPDAHLAEDVCIGAVTATSSTLYPGAVGGDIGCGMATLRFDVDADRMAEPDTAARILSGLLRHIPFVRHRRDARPPLPATLRGRSLTSSGLERVRVREGEAQLGTLGSGNHFVELQADDEEQVWAMIHSGSRGIGPAIRDHHLSLCRRGRLGLGFLDADSTAGSDYLADVAWALDYADASRRRMMAVVSEILNDVIAATPVPESYMSCHHNHVRQEVHNGEALWVHRKGAIPAGTGEPGLIPGSMGTFSVHVQGLGNAESLASCAHGAGRRLSRSMARRQITVSQLGREAGNVFFDHRLARSLREEAPAAYKDLEHVLRAQRDLARVVRRLRPLLVYKGA